LQSYIFSHMPAPFKPEPRASGVPPWEMYLAAPIFLGMALLVSLVAFDTIDQILPSFSGLWKASQKTATKQLGLDSLRSDLAVGRIRQATIEAASLGRELLLSESPSGGEHERELLRGVRSELSQASREYEQINPLGGSLPQWLETRNLLAQYQDLLDHVVGSPPPVNLPALHATLQQLSAAQDAVLRQAEKLSDIHLREIGDQEAQLNNLGNQFEVHLYWAVGLCLMIALSIAVLPILHSWHMQRGLQAQYQTTLRTKKDLQRLSANLVRAQEEERRSISRELHDDVGQALTAAHLDLALLEQRLPADRRDLQEFVHDGKALIEQTIVKLRDLSRFLRPNLLDDEGLAPAVKWLVKTTVRRSGIEIALETKNMEQRLAPEYEIASYRMAQEALTNIIRHSQATRAKIRLEKQDGELRIRIQDNGRGISGDAAAATGANHGLGLLGIRERVEELGGRFEIISQKGQGLCLLAEVPLPCDSPVAAPAKELSFTPSI
jgi:signal transduction histidine kinase